MLTDEYTDRGRKVSIWSGNDYLGMNFHPEVIAAAKAAHSAYEMFSWYKYLIVSLVFSHLGFWSGSLFLIAPFPDLCLLVLF